MATFVEGEIDISALLSAKAFLDQAIEQAKTDLEKAGAIQAFEFSYELSWKTMKRILAYRGVRLASPREVFRAAAKSGLIEDPKIWFQFLENRNMTAHTYNHLIADKIFAFLPSFSQELDQFLQKILPNA